MTPAPSHSNARAPRARIIRPDRMSCNSAAVWPMYRPMSAMNSAEIDCRGVMVRSTDEQKNTDSTVCSHGRLSSVVKSAYSKRVQHDQGSNHWTSASSSSVLSSSSLVGHKKPLQICAHPEKDRARQAKYDHRELVDCCLDPCQHMYPLCVSPLRQRARKRAHQIHKWSAVAAQ